MMQAGIDRVINDTPFRTTLSGFKVDAEAHYNCALESDWGWPRDLGFLRCLQKNFNANFHQSNVFLKCLDLSEGVMVESIQSRNSGKFLGSYNFVAMLMASLGVITAFLIFTAGGGWGANTINATKEGHIKDRWYAMSVWNVNMALLWSLFLLGSSLFYTFPVNGMWSDIPAVEGSSGFPTTPWGGYVCTLVSLGVTAFFFSYYMEWVFDTGETKKSIVTVEEDEKVPAAIVVPAGLVYAKQTMPDNLPFDPKVSVISVPSSKFNDQLPPRRGLPQPPSLVPQVPSLPSQRLPPPPPRGPPSIIRQSSSMLPPAPPEPAPPIPQYVEIPESSSDAVARIPQLVDIPVESMFYWNPAHRYLGIRADTHNYLDTNGSKKYKNYKKLLYINKAFACTWVYADCLLFIGMLNSQNSLLTENVCYVFYYIFLCRAFQFAGTFFMDRVIFEEEGKGKTVKKHQPNIIVACCHLCSLFSFILVLVHFFNTISLPNSIQNMGVGNQTFAVQIAFGFVLGILEALRHALVFITVIWGVHIDKYTMLTKVLFTADCILRTAFIISASVAVSQHLGEQNAILNRFMKLQTA